MLSNDEINRCMIIVQDFFEHNISDNKSGISSHNTIKVTSEAFDTLRMNNIDITKLHKRFLIKLIESNRYKDSVNEAWKYFESSFLSSSTNNPKIINHDLVIEGFALDGVDQYSLEYQYINFMILYFQIIYLSYKDNAQLITDHQLLSSLLNFEKKANFLNMLMRINTAQEQHEKKYFISSFKLITKMLNSFLNLKNISQILKSRLILMSFSYFLGLNRTPFKIDELVKPQLLIIWFNKYLNIIKLIQDSKNLETQKEIYTKTSSDLFFFMNQYSQNYYSLNLKHLYYLILEYKKIQSIIKQNDGLDWNKIISFISDLSNFQRSQSQIPKSNFNTLTVLEEKSESKLNQKMTKITSFDELLKVNNFQNNMINLSLQSTTVLQNKFNVKQLAKVTEKVLQANNFQNILELVCLFKKFYFDHYILQSQHIAILDTIAVHMKDQFVLIPASSDITYCKPIIKITDSLNSLFLENLKSSKANTFQFAKRIRNLSNLYYNIGLKTHLMDIFDRSIYIEYQLFALKNVEKLSLLNFSNFDDDLKTYYIKVSNVAKVLVKLNRYNDAANIVFNFLNNVFRCNANDCSHSSISKVYLFGTHFKDIFIILMKCFINDINVVIFYPENNDLYYKNEILFLNLLEFSNCTKISNLLFQKYLDKSSYYSNAFADANIENLTYDNEIIISDNPMKLKEHNSAGKGKLDPIIFVMCYWKYLQKTSDPIILIKNENIISKILDHIEHGKYESEYYNGFIISLIISKLMEGGNILFNLADHKIFFRKLILYFLEWLEPKNRILESDQNFDFWSTFKNKHILQFFSSLNNIIPSTVFNDIVSKYLDSYYGSYQSLENFQIRSMLLESFNSMSSYTIPLSNSLNNNFVDDMIDNLYFAICENYQNLIKEKLTSKDIDLKYKLIRFTYDILRHNELKIVEISTSIDVLPSSRLEKIKYLFLLAKYYLNMGNFHVHIIMSNLKSSLNLMKDLIRNGSSDYELSIVEKNQLKDLLFEAYYFLINVHMHFGLIKDCKYYVKEISKVIVAIDGGNKNTYSVSIKIMTFSKLFLKLFISCQEDLLDDIFLLKKYSSPNRIQKITIDELFEVYSEIYKDFVNIFCVSSGYYRDAEIEHCFISAIYYNYKKAVGATCDDKIQSYYSLFITALGETNLSSRLLKYELNSKLMELLKCNKDYDFLSSVDSILGMEYCDPQSILPLFKYKYYLVKKGISLNSILSIIEDTSISLPSINNNNRYNVLTETNSPHPLLKFKYLQMLCELKDKFDSSLYKDLLRTQSTSDIFELSYIYMCIITLFYSVCCQTVNNLNHLIMIEEIPRYLPFAYERVISSSHQISDIENFINHGLDNYQDLIPKNWNIISIDLCPLTNDLLLTKLNGSYFNVRLPLTRFNSRNVSESILTFSDALKYFNELINENNETTKFSTLNHGKNITLEEKKQWWKLRYKLNMKLSKLLENIENCWLGGFKGLFGMIDYEGSAFEEFKNKLLRIFDIYLPSRHKKKSKTLRKFNSSFSYTGSVSSIDISYDNRDNNKLCIDDNLVRLFLTLKALKEVNMLEDLIYFVLDTLSFHGEVNAYDEINLEQMYIEIEKLINSYEQRFTSNIEHTVLIIGKNCIMIPWESLPCLQGLSISRMPSLTLLIQQLRKINNMSLSINNNAFILNPNKDLIKTENTFKPKIDEFIPESWECLISEEPSESQFLQYLTDSEFLVYIGHGGGEQFVTNTNLKSLQKCASVFLAGCSSGTLVRNGIFEPYGLAYSYLIAGSPLVIVNLWDVTDKDIDKFTISVFEKWGLFSETDYHNQVNICQAVAQSRDKCILKYLNGAAPVVYGLPFNLNKYG